MGIGGPDGRFAAPVRIAVALGALALWVSPAMAQSATLLCEPFEGLTCDGWFTDDADVVGDDALVDEALDRIVGRYGVEIAFVIVADTGSHTTAAFAQALGAAWGVGDASRDDGVVIVVNLAERRVELWRRPGLPALDYPRVTGAATSFYASGDFQSGSLAIIGSLEQELSDVFDTGIDTSADDRIVTQQDPAPSSPDGTGAVGYVVAGVAALGGGALLVRRRRDEEERIKQTRRELIDDEVDRIDVEADELVALADFTVNVTQQAPDVPTMDAIRALREIESGRATTDEQAARALVGSGLAIIVDSTGLHERTRVPLSLAAAGERDILEGALQAGIAAADEVDPRDKATFDVRIIELRRIVTSLRPHRVAADRERMADNIADRLGETPVGHAMVTDAGQRLLRSAPALDGAETLQDSVAEVSELYATAERKTQKLTALYERLPANTARPAVAAALADVHRDEKTAVKRYEKIRRKLDETGSSLQADGLSVPAIAALLLMNNDGTQVDLFVNAYETHRGRGSEPGESVELALAGITHRSDIKLVRRDAKRLGLPISIAVALLRRRDDGAAVYEKLREELAGHGVKGDTRRTIAGILAVSLEPALAEQRWLAAREALAGLGLEGAYADVAAAFGASDPRGPRVFALAYAAQRQSLARSDIDDADRFAPELAHQGTRRQRDSWTGRPIPPGLGTFDPFTLLFYHWVITRGHRGSLGWEPIYRDTSWAGDRDSWWGGTGGFGGFGGGGFSGGGGGGSSWGGGGWGGGGGFGGFGGGGFGGGGGSSW